MKSKCVCCSTPAQPSLRQQRNHSERDDQQGLVFHLLNGSDVVSVVSSWFKIPSLRLRDIGQAFPQGRAGPNSAVKIGQRKFLVGSV